ncbi:MAG: riboflavin synthase [Planctomycetia bacterium]
MFTGIVTHCGRVEQAERRADGSLRLVVRPESPMAAVALGASVAVDGTCLTVVAAEGGARAFDAVPETLRKTTLGRLARGMRVNLERALRVGDELGGHWVQGHVDGQALLEAIEARGAEVRWVLRLQPGLEGSVLPKGSVTLAGVSLTVGEAWRDGAGERFSVYLIPHTLAVTTLGDCKPGDLLNLEADVLGRWITALHARAGSGGAASRPMPPA